jgi:hypothetical protein
MQKHAKHADATKKSRATRKTVARLLGSAIRKAPFFLQISLR